MKPINIELWRLRRQVVAKLNALGYKGIRIGLKGGDQELLRLMGESTPGLETAHIKKKTRKVEIFERFLATNHPGISEKPDYLKMLREVNEKTTVLQNLIRGERDWKKPQQKHKTPPVRNVHDISSNDFLQTYEWRKVRMQALKKYGARCQCCGATPADGVKMNVDHIKPRKLYPNLALSLDNLQVLCEECNHGKGNWDMTDWRSDEEDCDVVLGYFDRKNS